MKAICELTKTEHDALSKKWRALQAKIEGLPTSELLSNLKKNYGYAHYTFSGYVSDKLIDLLGRRPDSDEIIMIVDNGLRHYGATCSVDGRRFSGKVNID